MSGLEQLRRCIWTMWSCMDSNLWRPSSSHCRHHDATRWRIHDYHRCPWFYSWITKGFKLGVPWRDWLCNLGWVRSEETSCSCGDLGALSGKARVLSYRTVFTWIAQNACTVIRLQGHLQMYIHAEHPRLRFSSSCGWWTPSWACPCSYLEQFVHRASVDNLL